MKVIVKSAFLLLLLSSIAHAQLHELASMPSSYEESQQPPLSTEQIAERILRATVTIISYDRYGNINGTGSGFFVAANSIITNHHVIEKAHSVRYRIQGSESLFEVNRIGSVDAVNDLALLQTSRSNTNLIRLSSTSVKIGQTIYVAGAPQMLESTFSNGIVSALRTENGVDWIQITAPVSPGSSGGPVVDSKAELIGVTVGTISSGQNLNFAVPAKYVLDLIQSSGNRNRTQATLPSTPPSNTPSSTPSRQSTTCGGYISDKDGNSYRTVLIGNQCWMAENLKTSKYRNGAPIPNVIDNSLWGSLTTGAWANYGNNTPNNATHGKLYNWYAVADARSLCPVGWHVPSDSEWTVLSSFLETKVSFKLRSASGWGNTYNGSNISGFTAFPSGYRGKDGSFGFLGSYAYFWSSTQQDSGTAWLRNLSSATNTIIRFTNDKKQGFSVRCLRD